MFVYFSAGVFTFIDFELFAVKKGVIFHLCDFFTVVCFEVQFLVRLSTKNCGMSFFFTFGGPLLKVLVAGEMLILSKLVHHVTLPFFNSVPCFSVLFPDAKCVSASVAFRYKNVYLVLRELSYHDFHNLHHSLSLWKCSHYVSKTLYFTLQLTFLYQLFAL